MFRRRATGKTPDAAWQNRLSVTIDIRRLSIPGRTKDDARSQTENGKLVVAFLKALREADVLDPHGKQEVTLNGAYLQLTVTPSPGIGPEVHQSKIRNTYQDVMDHPLAFMANSQPAKTRSSSTTGYGGIPGPIQVEVWITF